MCAAGLMHKGSSITPSKTHGQVRQGFPRPYKLIKKAPQEMLHNFFDMIVEGRRDYENMSQELLCVK